MTTSISNYIVSISEDKNTIRINAQDYQFKRLPFILEKPCRKCHVTEYCMDVIKTGASTSLPLPCHPDARPDKKNGYFKRVSK